MPSSREALARLADAYHGHPSRRLTVVGITGTNGKTTTSLLVEALLGAGGRPTGVIGTIQYRVGDQAETASQTTPEALELQSLLARMVRVGVGGAAMEVSSHALALSRVDGIEFDVAVFTNLTQDHLDFHGTLEAYRDAKARLFTLLAGSRKPYRAAVVNTDDPAGAAMWPRRPPIRACGRSPSACTARPTCGRAAGSPAWTASASRSTRSKGPIEIVSPLVGEHNVMNLLGAIGVGLALDMEPRRIGETLSRVATVPGRFERVEAGQPFLVVVDYAHTPDALERVLDHRAQAAAPGRAPRRGLRLRRRPRPRQAPDHGRDRGAARRPRLGDLRQPAHRAARGDPGRDRDRHPGRGRGPARVHGRSAAAPSRPRCAGGATGDVVVIAGKGHETYQIIGTESHDFDDREVARTALRARGGAGGQAWRG